MKRFIAVALAAEILLPLAPGISQTTAPVASVGAIQISSVTVAEISTTQIKAAVNLVLIPDRNVTVTSVQLCALRLNGLPVFASPIRSEIAVRKGQSYTLPPLYVIALFRDLTNTQPLRQMIENQSVHVQGELISGVELGMLERLALHAQHPKVVSTISEDVPVSFAGDALEKTLALDPRRKEAHENLADTYLKMGRREDAKKEYETFLALNPSTSRADEVRRILKTLD